MAADRERLQNQRAVSEALVSRSSGRFELATIAGRCEVMNAEVLNLDSGLSVGLERWGVIRKLRSPETARSIIGRE
jgi:hypothetical protein